ncbi:MAG: mechanosensitive ion channel [Acidilobaceae archaeon]|nr:mechanosensitive ion channel [Acidilobaceae archaeon]
MVAEGITQALYERSGELLGALAVIAASLGLYLVSAELLRKLRLRGAIDRSMEEALRLVVIVIIAIVALPLAFSLVFRIDYGPLFSLLFLSLLLISLVVAGREYWANIFSFVVFSIGGTLKEGEYVRIDVGHGVYEGRVVLSKGEYVSLWTDHGQLIHVPYSKLHSSIITKLGKALVSFRLRARGEGLEVEKLVEAIERALSKANSVERDNVTIELLKILEEEDLREVSLRLKARLSNPNNVEKAKEEVMELLAKNVPYEISVAVEEE